MGAISGFIALGFGQIIGFAFPRDRPYLAHYVTLLVPHAPDTSFPAITERSRSRSRYWYGNSIGGSASGFSYSASS